MNNAVCNDKCFMAVCSLWANGVQLSSHLKKKSNKQTLEMEGQVESSALWDTVPIAVCSGCTVHIFYSVHNVHKLHGSVPFHDV